MNITILAFLQLTHIQLKHFTITLGPNIDLHNILIKNRLIINNGTRKQSFQNKFISLKLCIYLYSSTFNKIDRINSIICRKNLGPSIKGITLKSKNQIIQYIFIQILEVFYLFQTCLQKINFWIIICNPQMFLKFNFIFWIFRNKVSKLVLTHICKCIVIT